MKIQEAIVVLNDLDTRRYEFTHEEIYEAKRLGIEALKLVNEFRTAPGVLHGHKLPRES